MKKLLPAFAFAITGCAQQPETSGVPVTRNSIDMILNKGPRNRSRPAAGERETQRAFETERKADIAIEYTAGRKMDINIGRLTMLGGTPARDPQLFDPAELISFFNDQKRKDLVVVMFHKNIWTDDEEKREIAKMNAYFRDRGYKRIVIQQFRSWGRPTLSDIRP